MPTQVKRPVRMRGSVCISQAKAKANSKGNDKGKGSGTAEIVPSTRTLMMAIQEHLDFIEERHKIKERVEFRRIRAEEPDINAQEENCSPWLLIGSDEEGGPSPFWHNELTWEARRLRDGDPRFGHT
jgi:hypothetical protein